METPWGRADTTTIAPGIISCSTGSHGGFWVDERHFNAMPPEYQAIRYPIGRWPYNVHGSRRTAPGPAWC